jgi:MFS-type transporter involved in bile tolerance (Atg22 family)
VESLEGAGMLTHVASNSEISAVERAKIRALPWALICGALNCVFALWTFGGSVFVLFLNELGLPKGKIGLLLSLFPFCGLLALGFAPVAARLGLKRVFLACYGMRKFVMALLLLLPWVTTRFGQFYSLWFLGGVIIVFAVLRALGETAFYPWMQEFVPNRIRGRYTAWGTLAGLIASGMALAVASYVMGAVKGLNGYLLLIGTGSVIGFIGVLLHARVPGGTSIPKLPGDGSHWRNMLAALSDGNFKSYLGGMAGLTIGSTMLISFLPLYLTERIGLESATVVRLDILAMAGGALASLCWGWLSDRVGSRPVLMPACVLSLLAPVGWLLLPTSALGIFPMCALYFITGIAANGVLIGSGRLLFNGVVPAEKSTVYTSVYYALLGTTGGVGPLLAGGLLAAVGDRSFETSSITIDGYTFMFSTAILLLATGGLLYRRVRPDDRYTTRTAVRSFLNRIPQR